MRTALITAMVAAVAGAVPGVGSAGYVESAPRAADSGSGRQVWFGAQAPAGVTVVHVTQPPPTVEIRRGFGRSVPLRTAVEQIVPEGWRGEAVQGVDPQLVVSWQGGRDWVTVLADTLAATPYHSRLDWQQRIVTLALGRGMPNVQVAPAAVGQQALAPAAVESVPGVVRVEGNAPPPPPLRAKTAATTVGGAAQTTPAAATGNVPTGGMPVAGAISGRPLVNSEAGSIAVRQVAAASPTWTIRRGDGTVSGALRRWQQEANAAGSPWQIYWEADEADVPVEVEATFAGSLDDAVAKVVKALQSAVRPLELIIYEGNHVLRIVPKGAKL